jgi:hypothetical protein
MKNGAISPSSRRGVKGEDERIGKGKASALRSALSVQSNSRLDISKMFRTNPQLSTSAAVRRRPDNQCPDALSRSFSEACITMLGL